MKETPKTNKIMLDYIKSEMYISSDAFYDFILDVQRNTINCQTILERTKELRNILNAVDTYAMCAVNAEKMHIGESDTSQFNSCLICNEILVNKRADAKTCSDLCRKKLSLKRGEISQ
tara:strand:- start:161 stop:514 length:354 start_codon:yes stop_codon:yes gene_type:complete